MIDTNTSIVYNNKDICCYNTSLLIKYAREKGIDDDVIFSGIDETREVLLDHREWTSSYNWMKLAQNIKVALGNTPDILFKIATEIINNDISYFFVFFLKVAPFSLLNSSLSIYTKKYSNKNLNIYFKSQKDGELEAFFVPTNPSLYTKEFCDFNKGWSFSTIKFRGGKNILVKEVACVNRDGAPHCHYKFTFTPRPTIIRKIKDFFYFRFRDHRSIIQRLELHHKNFLEQYEEIVSLKDFYSHIMNTMTEGILWLDEMGKITFVNNGFCTMIQHHCDTVNGNNIRDFLSKRITENQFQDIFQQVKNSASRSGTHQLVFATKNGEERVGMANILWVVSEHYGPAYLVSIRDITEQKKVEKKLFASEAKYTSMYENSPAIIIGLSVEGDFLYANPAMEQLCDYTEDELKKMNLAEIIEPDTDFELEPFLKERSNKGERLQEIHFMTKTGNWKVVFLNSYYVYDDYDQVAGIAGIGVDITKTKLLTEQLIHSQRMDLLGKMAGGLAHDFKNLLSVIMGFTEFIVKKSEEKKTIGYAKNIQKASERGAELTRNLLTFSRGENVKKSVFNLNEMLQEIQTMIIPVLPSNVNVRIELSAEEYYMKGDEGKIHQSILNLCLNAKDAIDPEKDGMLVLRVKSSPLEGHGRIEVEDNGCGIDPAIIDRIYDPMFSTKKKQDNSGLGLSVVYGVVETHKGKVSVSSVPGEGTTFMIDLPLINNKLDKLDASLKEEGVVMIIDDDEHYIELCSDTLVNRGYEIIAFEDSTKALEWYKENSTDVSIVVVDIHMPQMNGIELVHHFRKIKKVLKIVWMGNCFTDEQKEELSSDPLLEKPFNPEALEKALSSFYFDLA